MIKRFIAAVLLGAFVAVAQDDEEWASGIGQKEQVTKGLVSYWSMRNSGTVAFDEYGTNPLGITNGAFSYAYGVVSVGATFNGSTYYMQGAPGVPAFGTGDFAVSLWAKANANANNNWLIERDNDTGTVGWNIGMINTAANKLRWNIRGATNSVFSDATVTSRWVHAVCQKSANVMEMYIDGARQTTRISGVTTNTDTTSRVTVGRYHTSGTLSYNGLIDEIRIYNRALTDDEIKQLYRMGKVIYENR